MARYRYISCHPTTREQLNPSLRLVDPEWSWVVGGNGSMSCKITVPEIASQIEQLRFSTQPQGSCIYVRDNEGSYPWGGPVVNRVWDAKSGTIALSVMEWRSWLYQVPLPPETDLSGDILYSWSQVDQITIARNIVTYALGLGLAEGSPPILFGSESLSGKLRDLNVYGSALKKAGELIDSIANRDGGFEWSIEVRPHPTDGLPQLYFVTYFPQRGSVIEGLMFKRTPGGGNMVSYTPIEESAAEWYSRYWATGVGSAPDQIFANDTDPDLALGRILRTESSTNYNSISDRSTLASHARRSRKFYSTGTNLVPVEVPLSTPDVDSYGIGDRARFLAQDRWQTLDIEAARVVEKKISMAGAGSVKLTLDITDTTLPETDVGGAI